MANLQDLLDVEDTIDLSGVEHTPAVRHSGQLPPPVFNGDPAEQPPPFPSLSNFDPVSTPPRHRLPSTASISDRSRSSTPACIGRRQKRSYSSALHEGSSQPTKKAAARKTNDGGKKRFMYTRAMTDQIMLWLQDAKQKGLMKSAKKKDYGPAWEHVVSRCSEEWPHYSWNTKMIGNKYNTERKRYCAWLRLINRSGVSYNWTTRLPEASEAIWEDFLVANNTATVSYDWLRTSPLGDRDVYEDVFWREQATGFDIVEPGNSSVMTTRTTTPASTTPAATTSCDDDLDEARFDDFEDDISMQDDSDGGDQEDEICPPSSASMRQMTARQKHRLQTDPDQSPLPDDVSDASLIPVQKRKKRESDTSFLGSSIQRAAVVISAPKLPGADDVGRAVADLQARFSKEISDEELMNCCDFLQGNPMSAVMWNSLTMAMKKRYVDRWKVG